MEFPLFARRLPFRAAPFPQHSSHADEIAARFLTAIANDPFAPHVVVRRGPDRLADPQQFGQTDPESRIGPVADIDLHLVAAAARVQPLDKALFIRGQTRPLTPLLVFFGRAAPRRAEHGRNPSNHPNATAEKVPEKTWHTSIMQVFALIINPTNVLRPLGDVSK